MTREPENGAPFLAGPTVAAPFHLAGDPAASEFTYGRYDNPTWRAYEEALVFSPGNPMVYAKLAELRAV